MKKKKRVFQYTGIAFAGVTAACTHTEPLPEVSYDPAALEEAFLIAEPEQTVSVPTALPRPLPGQIKPASAILDEKADPLLPQQEVALANETAKVEPVEDRYFNAIQVYPYREGALYQLYAAPEQVTDIGLQLGETIVAISAGDTVRWVIGDLVSGTGDEARAHILIKPVKSGLKTNLAVITDRRVYYLDLVSTKETYMASVSWRYPQEELMTLPQTSQTNIKARRHIIDQGLDIDRLQFRYRISGDTPPWRPVNIFDDSHKVYIQFPARLDQGEAPPLFVVGTLGESQLVNYRIRGRYYIVDQLFAAAELRLGNDPQQVVRITRKDVRSKEARHLKNGPSARARSYQ